MAKIIFYQCNEFTYHKSTKYTAREDTRGLKTNLYRQKENTQTPLGGCSKQGSQNKVSKNLKAENLLEQALGG